jgi:hypothetical protein
MEYEIENNTIVGIKYFRSFSALIGEGKIAAVKVKTLLRAQRKSLYGLARYFEMRVA